MIKNCAYIREFTPAQKKQLEAIAAKQKLKNATDVFLFVLDQHQDLQNDIARLNRIIGLKQSKIEKLSELQDEKE